MNWISCLRRGTGLWVRQGLDLLYPPRCVFCEAEVAAGAAAEPVRARPGPPVCGDCRSRLSHDRARCTDCGAPIAESAIDEAADPVVDALACRRCRRAHRRGLDGVVVLGAYDSWLRDQVLRTKRPAGVLVAAGLAHLLVDRHRDVIGGWGINLVVPVPMHWLRRCLRGTSSADELARWVGAGLGVSSAPAIRRRRATRMQNELPWGDRSANVRDAFTARRLVARRRVLLVDDVTTTGSTLLASAAAATAAGAAAVYAAVVARADRSDDS